VARQISGGFSGAKRQNNTATAEGNSRVEMLEEFGSGKQAKPEKSDAPKVKGGFQDQIDYLGQEPPTTGPFEWPSSPRGLLPILITRK
jgi:hypothetical protein